MKSCWPFITIVFAFCLGALVAKKDPQEPSRDSNVVESRSQQTSLLDARTKSKQDSGLLPDSVLKRISFEAIVDGKITQVARHVLALTDAQCIAVEAAISDHDEAIEALDQKLGLQANFIEKTDEKTVINLPDDAEARHAIKTRQWESILEAVGKPKAIRLNNAKPELNPSWRLERMLTLNHSDGSAETLLVTDVDGRQFSPQRSVTDQASLSPLWKDIVARLGLE